MSSIGQNRAGTASGVNNAVARTASLVAIGGSWSRNDPRVQNNLNARMSRTNLPASVAQSLQTQSIKLAAIDIPKT
jgi:hypothetical protein